MMQISRKKYPKVTQCPFLIYSPYVVQIRWWWWTCSWPLDWPYLWKLLSIVYLCMMVVMFTSNKQLQKNIQFYEVTNSPDW